jgi:hypothetical protein
MMAGVIVVALLVVLVGANLIFSKDRPTMKAWQADVVKSCLTLESQRQLAAAQLPADRAPTVEELMVFLQNFEPNFSEFETNLKSLDRPAGQDSKIDEMESATESYRIALHESSTNVAAAQVELAADGQTPESARLEAAFADMGLQKCNE